MELFDGIDVTELFDNESEYGKKYNFDAVTDERIKRAEKHIGYKLPKSYIELLKVQNGGIINDRFSNSWLTEIYGISSDAENEYGLEEYFDNWREWGYPDIGIPFGGTPTAGHDMYYMDYRAVSKNGEPRIVRIEQEADYAVYFVAKDLISFLREIYRNREINEKPIE